MASNNSSQKRYGVPPELKERAVYMAVDVRRQELQAGGREVDVQPWRLA